MSKTEEQTKNLINEIHQTINMIGLQSTIKALQVSRTKTGTVDDSKLRKIIQTVCDKFNITFTDLLNNYNSGWEKKYAVGFICYYAGKMHGYSGKELSVIFKKTPSLISKNVKVIKEMRANHKSETEMYKMKEYFDKLLNQ